ncbi:MAG TPA: hybrid sensor histidine kinase/response regulator [Magnetospirillum sp.]|nr:hybrid sensor histidine kinase/response regulator [Magnetospirillum sp.]
MASDLCRSSKTPCVVLSLPDLVDLGHSDSYAEGAARSAPLYRRRDWPELAASIRQVGSSGVPAEREIPGESFVDGIMRLHLAPVAGSGGPEAVMVWLDGPRLADEEVRTAAKQAVAAKSRFLAAASHDLRQPFQAMRFFHSVLADYATHPAAKRASDMLERALTSGEQLLNALLDISTLDAGTVQVSRRKFSLGESLDQLAAEYRPIAEAKGLCLRLHRPEVMVESDPLLVARIMRNLLANAIHYTRRGGVLLSARRRDGHMRIEVWDTGFGIPEQHLAEIFEEFHQLENPERDRTRGLGLGLAIVRRLSRLLGTNVNVHSRLGRGSVFWLTLPLAQQPVLADTKTIGEMPMPVTTRTILVVEDDPMVLMGLQMILETWGMSVLAAEDMSQVLQRLDEGKPDLILSDLRLRAGLTGFEVVERVRAILGKEVPAIILTGETGKSELAEGQRRNLTFLHKPIQADPLKAAITAAAG